MGGGYSASNSQSASSGAKTSVGPITFGGVAFGPQNAAGSNTALYLALAAAAAYFFLGGKP